MIVLTVILIILDYKYTRGLKESKQERKKALFHLQTVPVLQHTD